MRHLIFFILCLSLTKAVFSQPTEFYNTYFEGNALYMKGKYDEAIAKYNKALKMFEADYVYFNRANAYFGKKDFVNALNDYNKALKLNDRYAEAYYQRALVKKETGDRTFCDDFKKAARLDLDGAGEMSKKYCAKK